MSEGYYRKGVLKFADGVRRAVDGSIHKTVYLDIEKGPLAGNEIRLHFLYNAGIGEVCPLDHVIVCIKGDSKDTFFPYGLPFPKGYPYVTVDNLQVMKDKEDNLQMLFNAYTGGLLKEMKFVKNSDDNVVVTIVPGITFDFNSDRDMKKFCTTLLTADGGDLFPGFTPPQDVVRYLLRNFDITLYADKSLSEMKETRAGNGVNRRNAISNKNGMKKGAVAETGGVVKKVDVAETGGVMKKVDGDETGGVVKKGAVGETGGVVKKVGVGETGGVVKKVDGETGGVVKKVGVGETGGVVKKVDGETGGVVKKVGVGETGGVVKKVGVGETGGVVKKVDGDENDIAVASISKRCSKRVVVACAVSLTIAVVGVALSAGLCVGLILGVGTTLVVSLSSSAALAFVVLVGALVAGVVIGCVNCGICSNKSPDTISPDTIFGSDSSAISGNDLPAKE